ncbi:hypothetical protein SDRG_09157 [Saprolegnia diclina VS20]|uniref:Uncharacterized protein n=1 Tax=Saprolegnia diclina (strain VS20) TaxID=1156394 RepID=T0QEJ4_SAPDV|nr:hypothetical protein SDRG_09157 [Saprolegnia diclina VS20]EQC33171.1 hypothetical protein SDRG_09157 [Saprolegnia diclina VS20]|eukprot:XP_008613294.1 hypothetical protein SDRG_09157 [Saprolegnia diclina VS20]
MAAAQDVRLVDWGHLAKERRQYPPLPVPRKRLETDIAPLIAPPHDPPTPIETKIEDPECTFQPQRIAKMDAWVTSKYLNPRVPPRPRAEPVLSFTPAINRNVPIHASEPNVYNRLYADRVPRPANDTSPVVHSSKLSKAAIDACIARQHEYLVETQRRQRALQDATVYPFRPHINPRSQRLAARSSSMSETLNHAQRRRESKLRMLLAPQEPRSTVTVVNAVAQAKATVRLSRPKDAYYVPDFETDTSVSGSSTSAHAAALLYEKLQEQHAVQRHVSLRQHVDAILDDYARAS